MSLKRLWRSLDNREHPDAWRIDVWPDVLLSKEYVERDIVIRMGEPGWSWAVFKNDEFITVGDALTEEEALERAHSVVAVNRMSP